MSGSTASMPNPADAADWCAAQKWFHAIDFGGGLTSPGRFGDTVPPNYTLYGFFDYVRHMTLNGATCVDVGTMDGIAAFIMKKLGAERVIATDLAPRETFEFGRRRLGLEIEYVTPVAVLDLPERLGRSSVDLVMMAGVLYHVFDPLTVLSACREVLRRGGFLLAETSYLFDESRPVMSFNPADTSARGIDLSNIFWRPSKSAVEGMLHVAGFEVVGSVAVNGRITVLARALRPSQIADVSPREREILERYMKYENYGERVDYDALERDQVRESCVRYQGPEGDRLLHRMTYRPEVPLQPDWRPPAGIGSIRARLDDWRFVAATRLARWRSGR